MYSIGECYCYVNVGEGVLENPQQYETVYPTVVEKVNCKPEAVTVELEIIDDDPYVKVGRGLIGLMRI